MDKSLAKNAVFNIIYKVLNVIFPLITSAYIARVLLPTGVGRISYAQNIASIFVLLAAMGIPTYGVRVISRAKNQEEINRTFSELIILLCVSTLIFFSMFIFLTLNIPSFRQEIKLYLAVGLQILLVCCNVDWFYQGKEEYKFITIRSIIVKIISFILILIFVKSENDYVKYALISSFAVAGNYIFNIINIKKYARFSLRNISLYKHLAPVFTLLFSIIAIELYSKVDITMLGFFCEDSSIGYFSNAVKVISLVLTIITAVTAVFLPRLSSLYNDNRYKFNDLVNYGVQIISIIAIPSAVGLFLIANDFVVIMFGSAYSDAGLTLKILCPLIIIKGLGDLLCYQVIICSGKEKYFLITNTSAALVNIVLNYFLIQIYQQNGAALASVISELIVNVGMIFITLKVVKLDIKKSIYLPILLGTIGVFFVIHFLDALNLSLMIRFCLKICLSIFVYLVLNVLMKNSLIFELIYKIRKREK